MNTVLIIIEGIVLAVLFTAADFASLKNKEAPASVHNYPPDIQKEYYRTHEKLDVTTNKRKVVIAKSIAIIIFTLLLAAGGYATGARTFIKGFWFGAGMMLWIGVYDTVFVDWVLFANLKCFRLPGTEDMDEAYHRKWFHLKGMLFPGILFALIVGLLVGLATKIISG